MNNEKHPDQREFNRRRFVTSCAGGALITSRATAAEDTSSPVNTMAIDFDRSFLFCTPKGTDLWVRSRIETRMEVFDRRRGEIDEYVLSVVAKTGLTKNHSTGVPDPGYDYWIIFSKKHVYTRRTHTSSYFNNPTTLTLDEFGVASWRLLRSPALELRTVTDLRRALENWHPIVARSEFSNDHGNSGFAIEYPVKWADCNLQMNAFRVETGPVILVDLSKIQAGRPLRFEDFQWAHLDYHSFDRMRCLLDVSTPILTGATFSPPREHGREERANPPLSESSLQQIKQHLFHWADAPISETAMQDLFQTDHYSTQKELTGSTKLYALDNQS